MSRRLRENTSRKLNAMTHEERQACLRQTHERFCARRQAVVCVKFSKSGLGRGELVRF